MSGGSWQLMLTRITGMSYRGVRNWGGTEPASLEINGDQVTDFSQGIVHDTDGTPTLVLWIPWESVESNDVVISKG